MSEFQRGNNTLYSAEGVNPSDPNSYFFNGNNYAGYTEDLLAGATMEDILKDLRKVKENLDLAKQYDAVMTRDEMVLQRNSELQALDLENQRAQVKKIMDANNKVLQGQQIAMNDKQAAIQAQRRASLGRLDLLGDKK